MTVASTLVCPLCRIALTPPDTLCPRDGTPGEPASFGSIPAPLAKRFRVLEPFAQGSTGTLFLADESETGRRGLLKVLAPVAKHREPERARLRRELSKQAGLPGGRLVVPWVSGESEGATWLFRPWLDGVSLRVQLQRGPLPVSEALSVAGQLAIALEELHHAGLLHRDLKPGHVFLQTNSTGIVRAHLIEPGLPSSVSRPGNSTIYGTIGYVAPEQLQGKLVSFRSDLYSLGCVMYEMFAGHPPFRGETDAAALAAQLSGELPPLEVDLPDSITTLLRSLLAREPQERPFSAQKLRRFLDPYTPDGAPMTRRPTTTFGAVPEPEKPAEQPAAAAQVAPSSPPPPPRDALRGTMLGVPQSVKPPPPPTARPTFRPTTRGMAPPAPPPVSRSVAPPSVADATQQLDMDQLEEIELEAAALQATRGGSVDRTEELGAEHLTEAAPKADAVAAAEAKAIREDHTVPVRLEQILAIAPAKLRASAAPPPMAEPAAAPVITPAAAPVETPQPAPAAPAVAAQVAPSRAPAPFPKATMLGVPMPQLPPQPAYAPLPQQSLFETAKSQPPAAPDVTMQVDEDYSIATTVELAKRQVGAEATHQSNSSLPPPAESLFGQAPEEPAANPFRAAFEADDDELESESTKVAERPLAPAARANDDDPTQIHPSALRGNDAYAGTVQQLEDLEPQRLQDTLHPYAQRRNKPQRKALYAAGGAALVVLLALGVSALMGDDEEPVAQGELAKPAPAASAPAPAAEPAPAVTALAPAPTAQPIEAKPEPAPVVEPVASAESIVAAHAEREPTRTEPARAEPTRSREPAARSSSRDERRREKREPAAKKPDASAERAAKWAEARDQARAHYSAKRYKQAAQSYEKATQYDPTNAGTFAGLGAARLQAGDAKGAVAAYQRAIQLSPSSAGFHVALGRAYVATGDKTKARASYKRALALDPKNDGATKSLKEIGG